MRIVTRQELADSAASEWKEQFCSKGVWHPIYPDRDGERREAIYNKLVALGEHPDPDAVDAVIGNGSFTHRSCVGCNEWHDRFVVMQEYPTSRFTIALCLSCAEKAVEMLRA